MITENPKLEIFRYRKPTDTKQTWPK
jgi:hypothetical protein